MAFGFADDAAQAAVWARLERGAQAGADVITLGQRQQLSVLQALGRRPVAVSVAVAVRERWRWRWPEGGGVERGWAWGCAWKGGLGRGLRWGGGWGVRF